MSSGDAGAKQSELPALRSRIRLTSLVTAVNDSKLPVADDGLRVQLAAAVDVALRFIYCVRLSCRRIGRPFLTSLPSSSGVVVSCAAAVATVQRSRRRPPPSYSGVTQSGTQLDGHSTVGAVELASHSSNAEANRPQELVKRSLQR